MEKAAFFFDIGHTLVTGAPQSPRRLLGTVLGLDEAQTKRVGKLIMTLPAVEPVTVGHSIAALLPRHEPDLIQREVERLWNEQIECVREIPGATELIRRLKRAGHHIGVISNIWHPFFLGFQKTCPEIHTLVDFPFLSYRLGTKKPSERLFHGAVETARAQGIQDCWMVGDSYELDIAPARRTGMRGLWILCRPERERPVLADILNGNRPAPDGCVPELVDVQGFLERRGYL